MFFDEKMVEMGLVEISTVPNRPFVARDDQIFWPVPNGFQSPRKIFNVDRTILGLWRPLVVENR